MDTKQMYVCVLDEKGEVREHRNVDTRPDAFLKAIAPFSREDVVVAVECMFTWYSDCRSLPERGYPLRSGLCPLHESSPWRKGKERQDRFEEDCCFAQGGFPYPSVFEMGVLLPSTYLLSIIISWVVLESDCEGSGEGWDVLKWECETTRRHGSRMMRRKTVPPMNKHSAEESLPGISRTVSSEPCSACFRSRPLP